MAVSTTGTRLPVPTGSVTSGVVADPIGTGGMATPAIEAIRKLGALISGGTLATVTPVGAPGESPGVLVPVKDNVLASTRIRPLFDKL